MKVIGCDQLRYIEGRDALRMDKNAGRGPFFEKVLI
jgi:hypothetical protein